MSIESVSVSFRKVIPYRTMLAPVLALVLYFCYPEGAPLYFTLIIAAALMGAVLSGVHHAEVVAHKVGEPFGTLVLAVAITVIEVSLVVSLMISGGEATSALARDTVFAATMIILTGIIGLCLLIGGLKHNEQRFKKQAVSAALSTLTAIAILTLVLPNYTTSAPGPYYNNAQLIFVAIVCLVLYLTFVFVQTVRHRGYFLPENADKNLDFEVAPPSNNATILSLVFLLVSLCSVVLIAKSISPVLELYIDQAGAPKSVVGIVVALVILLPEGLAAVKAARKNRLQTSLNLALGSALASIGLTIPSVAIVSIYSGFPITLGIDAKSIVLLITALFSVTLSFYTDRTTVMQGVVLLVLFAVYLFVTVIP